LKALLGDAIAERLAVLGGTARLCGYEPRAQNARALILSRQTCSASTARAIAASLMRRDARRLAEPDDAGEGVDHAKTVAGRPAISRRQLLVPRSSAA